MSQITLAEHGKATIIECKAPLTLEELLAFTNQPFDSELDYQSPNSILRRDSMIEDGMMVMVSKASWLEALHHKAIFVRDMAVPDGMTNVKLAIYHDQESDAFFAIECLYDKVAEVYHRPRTCRSLYTGNLIELVDD